MTSDDLVPQVLAAIAAKEASAKSWAEDDLNALTWRVAGARQLTYQNNVSEVVTAIDCKANRALSWEEIYVRRDLDGRRAAFIVENDPDAVLRRCAADREIVALHNIVWRDIGWLAEEDGEVVEEEAELPVCGLCVPRHSSFSRREDVPEGTCRTVRILADSYGVAPATEPAESQETPR